MSVVRPCPWCGSPKMDWVIPAHSSRVIPQCDDCGAQGPGEVIRDRSDREAALATAVRCWNARSYPESADA